MEEIKVIIKQPGQPAYQQWIVNDLGKFQQIVGGYIEVVWLEDGLVMIVNEEGKINRLPANFICERNGIKDMIVGPAIICGANGEEFANVPISKAEFGRMLKKWGN